MTILKFLWPFIWEIVLGKQTFIEAVRTNKKQLSIFLMIIGLILSNIWAFGRAIAVGGNYLDLREQCLPYLSAAGETPVIPNKKPPAPSAQQVDEVNPKVVADADIKNQLLDALSNFNTHDHNHNGPK